MICPKCKADKSAYQRWWIETRTAAKEWACAICHAAWRV